MKVYTCTAEFTEGMPNDDGSFRTSTEERTFSNLKKAYAYALAYVGKPSGITPSYPTLARRMTAQGYWPIFGKRYEDDVELGPAYFLLGDAKVDIKLREVE